MTESSQKCPTPRQSFAEAMRAVRAFTVDLGGRFTLEKEYRQATEAFAWASYRPVRHTRVESGPLYEDENGDIQHEVRDVPVGPEPPTLEEWTASILKEVFGD